MTTDEAKPILSRSLYMEGDLWRDNQKECDRMANALLAWFNRRTVSKRDLKLLKRVAKAGFEFWHCTACGDLVCSGDRAISDDPRLSWDQFQGVWEVDYSSYPGGRVFGHYSGDAQDLRCNRCRCHDTGAGRLPAHYHEMCWTEGYDS